VSETIEGSLFAGRYRMGPVIGRGGMSIVHAAEDARLGRPVAIKLINSEQSLVLTERLFREAKAAARACHPAVVTVFGFGTDEATGRDYLAMERLLGEDLGARVARQGCLPIADVMRFGTEIADALAHVHEAGVVHRDVKPSNVYLAQRGLRVDEVKLLDFGIAKQLDLQTLTATGQIIGTRAYMAPEQIVDPRRVDPRSDIYALGMVLLECLIGRLPYRPDTVADLVSRVMIDDGPPLDELCADGPGPLVDILSRCLRRRASERFASARALCDSLIAAQR
jgi:serine/threonine protein kinase